LENGLLMVTKNKEWVLTREALDALLAFLDSDPVRAADEYEQIRRRLMKLFRWRGCLPFEEYTDQTIDRVARRIAEGGEIRTTNPYALFYGVAINVIREHWRRSERESQALGGLYRSRELSPNPEDVRARMEDERQSQMRGECLRQCLRTLPADAVSLIKRYYGEGDILDKNQRKQIAETLKISVNTLRVRAFRIRTEVEKCVHICLTKEGRTEIVSREGH